MDSSNIYPIRSLTIEYEATAKFGDLILITTQITSIGSTSFKLKQEIRNKEKNTLLTSIESTRVIFNLNTNQTIDVSEFFRACTLT